MPISRLKKLLNAGELGKFRRLAIQDDSYIIIVDDVALVASYLSQIHVRN
jgi:hypothetical protein